MEMILWLLVPFYTLVSLVLLQIPLILDCVDGMLARAKSQSNIFGKWHEGINHTFTPLAFVASLGIINYLAFRNKASIIITSLTMIFPLLMAIIRFTKISYVLKDISERNKLPSKMPHTSIGRKLEKKNQKLIFILMDIPFSGGTRILFVTLVFFLGYLHYLIYFYFVYYLLLFIVKFIIEYKIGFKVYGYER